MPIPIAVLAFCTSSPALEGAEAHWLRAAAISPDGTHVAFSYAGDLWVAPLPPTLDGAPLEAELLTTHVGYETRPVWGPDSRTIAFSADWFGQMDVFLTTLERRPATRLTFHSADDYPTSFSPDGSDVWFTSRRQDAAEARLGSAVLSELYAIPVDGGAPRRLLTTPAEMARPNGDGSIVVYEDLKGYENVWRKHHVSSVARDLWSWRPATGHHEKLTSFRGEDRNPVWMPDGSIAFLSERDGSFNVWTAPLDDVESARPLTHHTTHPVRFLSAARDGTLAYTWDGDLWILRPGDDPTHLNVIARVDQRVNPTRRETFREGATEMAVSPDDSEVAFIVHGEIFVASVQHGTTRRVTETPEQERSVTWGKDGRTLYYASEREGSWNLYSCSIVRDEEQGFSSATLLSEKPLLADEHETFQPLAAPDGKHLAYLVDREAIHVLDLVSGEHRLVVSDEWNYSYSDGDISYRWSPDSRWLTFTYAPYHRFSGEIGAVSLERGEIVNVSRSGYEEGGPRFTPDATAIVYTSGRYGQKEHSGRGGQGDVLAVYLTQAAFDRALLSWEELEELEGREKDGSEKNGVDEEDADASGDSKGAESGDVERVELDPEGLDDRRRRLTMQSAPLGDVVVTADGEAVIYLAEVDGKWDVWTCHLRDRKTQRLLPLGGRRGGGDLHLSQDGKTLIVRTAQGTLIRAKIQAGEHGLPEGAKPEPIAFAAEMTIDGPAERERMFEHVWRQMAQKFYRADLHGVDWVAMKEAYARFLPHVRTGYDFAELLSEMLGELNASHTGGRYRPRGRERDDTASLGLLYGDQDGEGIRIDEVLRGGPADRAESRLAAGVRITAIDGVRLTPSENPWQHLDRKDEKPVLLSCVTPDGETFEEVVRPVSSGQERELMYRRWIRRSEELVDELSGGRVGYVHVRGMNDRSYREVYEEVLGRCSDKEALIVDTRWNGGGWLHDQLVTFLGGTPYCQFVPRDKEPGRFGGEPSTRWARPVCVVQNEGNYSDAHFFPYAFKTLGLGELIGAPVAGTSTAVWWERLYDGATVFGIPQLGVLDTKGRYLENQELFPDIEVYNDPESVAEGRDRQLEEAVRRMLARIDEPVDRGSNASAGR